MKITAQKILFPPSSWVHALILTCDNKFAVWYKKKGVPTVCCLYPGVDGPTFYNLMTGAPSKGHFVWYVVPYRQPYIIVAPPTPPFGCKDSLCWLFLNGDQSLTAAADNQVQFGSIDLQCSGWNLVLPGYDVPAAAPSPMSIGMDAILKSPYPATIDLGYSLNNGPITYQTLTVAANSDGTGSANYQFYPVTTSAGDTIQLFLRPPSDCILIGAGSGETSVAHFFGF